MLVQAAAFGHGAARALGAVPTQLELFFAEVPRIPPNGAVLAWRGLPVLARQIPRSARVLLLTPLLESLEYEHYFLPRPFAVLHQLDPGIAGEAERLAPRYAHLVRARLQWLAERDQLVAPERLQVEVQRADFVVAFLAPSLTLTAIEDRLEPVAEREGSRLFRVRR